MNIDDFAIQIASPITLSEFDKLERICFSGDRINSKEYRRLYQRTNTLIYGVWFKHQLIASAVVIMKKHKKICRLYSFAVHPAYRGIGIANALLSAIEDACANLGYNYMNLECSVNNKETYGLYVGRGFFTIGKYDMYYENGDDAYRMRKILTQRPDIGMIKKPTVKLLERHNII